jgi:hypothetical protein
MLPTCSGVCGLRLDIGSYRPASIEICGRSSSVEAKKLRITADKVEAHGEQAVLRGQMRLQEYLGNLLADAGAGAAAQVSVDSHAAQSMSIWASRVFLIARRWAIIDAEAWSSEPHLVPELPPRPRLEPPPLPEAFTNLQRSVARMAHRLHARGGYVHCSHCRRRRRVGKYKYWTSTPCAARAGNPLGSPGVVDDETTPTVAPEVLSWRGHSLARPHVASPTTARLSRLQALRKRVRANEAACRTAKRPASSQSTAAELAGIAHAHAAMAVASPVPSLAASPAVADARPVFSDSSLQQSADTYYLHRGH